MRGRRLVAVIGAGLLALGFLSATFVAVTEPLSLGDFTAIWGLKARAIDRSGDLSSVFRVDPSGAFSHPEYPLAWPLVLASAGRLVGGWDELRLTWLRPLLLAAAAFLTARLTKGSLATRLFAAATLTLLPYFHELLYVGYAEALLLVFVLLALNEWDGLERSVFALGRFALFWVLAASTKNEGLVASGLAVVFLWASRRRRAAIATALAVAFAGVAPWTAFRLVRGPGALMADFSFSAFHPGQVVRAISTIVSLGTWPAWCCVVLLVAVPALSPETRRRRWPWALAAGLYVVLFVLSYGFSRLDPAWHVENSFGRLLLLPAAILIPAAAEAAEEALSAWRAPAEPAPA